MNNINNDKFIDSLVTELRPVRPLPAPWIRALIWILPQFAISIIAIYLSSPIHLDYISNFQFLAQIIVASIALFVGAYLGFANTIPGLLSEKKTFVSFIPFILLFLLLGTNYFFPVVTSGFDEHRPHCAQELSALMIIGFIQNYYMLKKGFLAFENTSVTLSFLTSAMIPIIIMYFACSFSTQHLLVAHYLPVVGITILGLISFKLKNKL